jgi:hypothetical protein
MPDLESTLDDPNVFVKCLDNAVRENKGDVIKELTGWYLRKSLIEPQVGVGSSLLKAYLELDSQPVVALSTLNTIFDICVRGLEKLQATGKAPEITGDFLKNARDSYIKQLQKVEWACTSRAIDCFSKDDREKGDFWYTRSTDAAELLKLYQPKEAKQ